jgi:photosystem II stability/assembly factor-like uncharacterized protein
MLFFLTALVTCGLRPATLVTAQGNALDAPLLQGFRWRLVGPAEQNGRVEDIAVDERTPSTYFIGLGGGGVWRTTDDGATFAPVFDVYGTGSIGDLALAPSDPNVLYVGTGEANNGPHSSPGTGMWKSTNASTANPHDIRFEHIGLPDSQSIARVVVHPADPDIVWVAVAGHLYGPNTERGVFMTTDGGTTWTRTLYVTEDTGASDLVIDPSNPDILWATTYEHRRSAWGYNGGGPGSNIYQSIDGGRTWKKVRGNGLPNGTRGRIGLDISRSQPDVIYAQIEVAPDREPSPMRDKAIKPPAPGEAPAPLPLPTSGPGSIGRDGNRVPDPQSSGIWKSIDKGKTWQFMSNENQRPVYFSQIRVDPNAPAIVYVGGGNGRKSTDSGRTFVNINPGAGHVDTQAIWIDPSNSNHVMYGHAGGLAVSRDAGRTWTSVRTWFAGLASGVSVDMKRPYRVCTELNNNSWCGPSHNRSGRIQTSDWIRVDEASLPTVPPADPRSPTVPNSSIRPSPFTSITAYARGRDLLISRDGGSSWVVGPVFGRGIDPRPRQLMEEPYWVPACSSATRGMYCIMSKGDGARVDDFGAITEMAESPVMPGVLWIGTSDGNVQVSKDAGKSWTEVGKNIPVVDHEYPVSGLEASWFDGGTAYVSLDGHRSADVKPYVFKTTDYGQTWKPIAGNLPVRGSLNSIRQDPVNPRLLFAPTESGFFISLTDGESWTPFMPNLPAGRVDEVVVHPRDHDLVILTASRGVWIMDDISPLQQLHLQTTATEGTLFKPRDAVLWKSDRAGVTAPADRRVWQADAAPRGTAIAYQLSTAATDASITIVDTVSGRRVFMCAADADLGLRPGLTRFQWPLLNNQPSDAAVPATGAQAMSCSAVGAGVGAVAGPDAEVRAGVYQVTLAVNGKDVASHTFTVVADPLVEAIIASRSVGSRCPSWPGSDPCRPAGSAAGTRNTAGAVPVV